ncbi:MAG: TRAP transporter substrate-binding protein [Saprospiraceae bacterium]|nr:TRAP transporter substrate-binding protein [Saprospiraceae bacterium]
MGINRKDFIKHLGVAAVGGAILTSCKDQKDQAINEAYDTKTSYTWKMVTTWPPNFPVVGEACHKFARQVNEMSAGQFTIKVYGGGELIPSLEVFDAVSSGAAEIGHGASYYWAGKSPATQFFTSVPFGMNAQQMNAWLYYGGGLELWKEVYARFGLLPMPGGNTGVQMGGWFNREINTVEDFKGLKMRIPGLGGKVLEKLGATVVLSAVSEIYTNLERGVIDATEWVGPYHDYTMGYYEIAKYYYAPGWHEPGSNLEFMFNKRAFEALPKNLQTILEVATAQSNMYVLSEFEAKNNEYLQKIIADKSTEVRKFSPEVLKALKEKSIETLEAIADGDEMSAKVYDSYKKFQTSINQWAEYSEKLYYEI